MLQNTMQNIKPEVYVSAFLASASVRNKLPALHLRHILLEKESQIPIK
jgi:hypothetical protein